MLIRRLNCFDYRKIKRLVRYLAQDDSEKFAKSIMEEPLGIINALLPIKLKFKSESYILIENNEILGLITVGKTPGNPYKINILKLIFKENMYEVGKSLVEFVINKLGGKGALTFTVTTDECHEELLELFCNGCGFRICSSETLWKIENPQPIKSDIKYRYAQKSDSEEIAQLYNSEIDTIYRQSLSRNPKEFTEPLFEGFKDYYKTRFVLEENNKIVGYFSITTYDNMNYIYDLTLNSGYEFDYDKIIGSMMWEVGQKKKLFYPLIKQKRYIKKSEELENYLKTKGYIPIQTQVILVKDYYKPLRQENTNWNVFIMGENCLSNIN